MLGLMPRLYDDELVYSWLARYHLYAGNSGPKQTMKDLFGREQTIAVPDLPTNLQVLEQRMEHFSPLEAQSWLYEHTFFGYYTHFTDVATRQKTMNLMLHGGNTKVVHLMIGMMASAIKEKAVFQYCPACVAEDIKHYGETYWRMSHQLPGLLVCTKHQSFLQSSSVLFRPNNKHAYDAATLQSCPPVVKVTMPSVNQDSFDHLVAISQGLEAVARIESQIGSMSVQQIYQIALKKHGFATVNGRVDQQFLAEQFQSFFGQSVLSMLQSEISPDNDWCWLKSLTRKHRKVFHPIRHILMMRFLGIDLADLAESARTMYRPFGDGPHLCLNTAADHYREPVVTKLTITHCSDTKRPVGTFTCSCGFSFSRRGPDVVPEDRFKIGRIKQFGAIWINQLEHLIKKEQVSFREAARRLRVDTQTIIRQYRKLPTVGHDKKEQPAFELLEDKKQEWMLFHEEHKGGSICQLRELRPALYAWLYRHCKEWLLGFSYVNRRQVVFRPAIWSKRDEELHNEVNRLLNTWEQDENVKPVRITRSRIGNLLRKKAWIEKHIDKMPKTKSLFAQVCETTEQYQIRRICWAGDLLRKNRPEIAEWELRRLAAVPKRSGERVENIIQQVIKLGGTLTSEFPTSSMDISRS